MPNIDLLICGSGHSLIASHKSEDIDNKVFKVEGDCSIDHSKFGLFNVTSPNMNTYYPDLDPKTLQPQDEDFIYPVFRLLSEVVVNKRSNPVDFRANEVLKNSMNLLIGQTVYSDHEDIIGNHVGVIQEVFWQESYTTKGVTVPAGINAILKLDAKSNPKIARGILQEPPAIHSVSVSVMYAWEKSHKMDDKEFYKKLGSFTEKGELVRKIASDIVLYTELSLVPHGADPFAQILKDGKISNPQFAKKFYSLGGDKFSYVDFKNVPTGDIEVEISKFNSTNERNNKTKSNMKIFLDKLSKHISFEGEVDEAGESLLAALDQLLADNLKNEQAYAKEIADLKTERDNFKSQFEAEQQENTDLKADKHFIEIGKANLTSTVEKALNLYKTVKGDKADEKMIEVISNSPVDAANAFIKEYEEELNELSPLTCQDCKSENVVRASINIEDPDQPGVPVVPSIKTNLEVIQNRRKSNFSVKGIHG